MKGVLLNPIRFYNSTELPDYLTKFPNFDNVPYGQDFVYGVNSSPSGIRMHTGTMYLQFYNPDNAIKNLLIYKYTDGVWVYNSMVASVNISPVGWVGYQIHKITLSLADGIYYATFGTNCISDVFMITASVYKTKDLVQITYSHTVNDYSCIFGANYFTAYFKGSLAPGKPKTEIESYDSDRGNPIKLKSTPKRVAELKLYGVNYLYKDTIDTIFSCDTILINGVAYENIEVPTYEDVAGSDMTTITIELIQKNNNYYHE